MKKQKLAIALKYDSEKGKAPKIVAKGKELVAENIIDKAEQSGVEKVENPALAKELIKLEINQEIPEELYQAVAEIMVYIYRLSEEKIDE